MTNENTQAVPLDSLELAKLCVAACEATKARDILLFDVHENTIVADYYLVCSGTSMPQINAIAERVRRTLADHGVFMRGQDGRAESRWMVLDYGVLLVHILEPEMRNFYALEELWDESKIVMRVKGDGTAGAAPVQDNVQ